MEKSKVPVTLQKLLEKNPQISRIVLHFDNDIAGRKATKTLEILLKDRYEVVDEPPKSGKDFNDFLCIQLGILKQNERSFDEMNEKITVLLVEPGKYPKPIEIEDTLEAMQEVVGGDIEEYMPFDDEVAIICNEEGKMNGSELNRAVYSKDKQILDVIAGKFFIAYAPFESESFLSMPKDLMKKYEDKFRYPEKFYKTPAGVEAKAYKPVAKDMDDRK